MESFSLLWQIFAFAVVKLLEAVANVADEVMFTLEDIDVYGKIAKFLSFCVGNYYFWQALAVVGFYRYLRRLADKYPASPIIVIDSPVHVGPSKDQLLADKETALQDATRKYNNLDRETAVLRSKVDRLEKEVDFISKDRYALVREKFTLQNKLGDFNSWPEFRIEFDRLTTEFIAMKSQRAREHILQERTLRIAQEARAELAAAKRSEAMSKTAHSKELEQVEQERDEAREKYKTLLATTAAATSTAATNTAATTTATTTTSAVAAVAATATVAKGNTPGDIALKEENARLTLSLRSQTSLLSKKSSELDRMQSLLKTRSNHSALQLKTAASTITSLEEDKAKAEERVAELERDVQEANEKAEQMEDMYMGVAFGDEGEGDKEQEEEEQGDEEEGSEGGEPETSWLLEQIVAMSKKGRKKAGTTAGGSGADGSGGEDEEEEEDDDDDNNDDDDGDEGGDEGNNGEEGDEKKIHDENEDLFKEMMGL